MKARSPICHWLSKLPAKKLLAELLQIVILHMSWPLQGRVPTNLSSALRMHRTPEWKPKWDVLGCASLSTFQVCCFLFRVQIKPVPEGTFGPVTSLFWNKVHLLSEVCTSARNSAGTFLWRYELNQLKPVEMFTVKLPITSTHNNRNPLFIFFFFIVS